MNLSLDKFYKTTSGFPVVLIEIRGAEHCTFDATGSIYRKHKGLHINPEFNIWRSSNGTNMGVGTSSNDLQEIPKKEWQILIEK